MEGAEPEADGGPRRRCRKQSSEETVQTTEPYIIAMNKRNLVFLLCSVFGLLHAIPSDAQSASPTAATDHIFPQFANGKFIDGTYYRTTLMISNPSDEASGTCSLQLRGLTLANFGTTYTLAPGGFVITSTDGGKDFQSGYASLQCSIAVDAQLLYSYYAANGDKLSEATVFSSGRASSMTLPADERDSGQLGLAIANDTDQSVTYYIAVRNMGFMASASVRIGPRTSVARFLSQLVPEVPPNSVTFVTVSAAGVSTSIIGLRYTGKVFTTIPSTIVGAATGQATSYHVFPQFADGRFSDGTSYRTTRMLVNPDLNLAIDCTTLLHGMTTNGASSFNVRLAARVTVVSGPTGGVQAFQSGYATTQCDSIVYGELLYSYYDANGVKLSEATVFSSPSASRVQILADSRGGSRVGLAIANDTDQTNIYTIGFYDSSSMLIAATNLTLAGRSSLAKFIDELATLPVDYYGKVIVSSPSGAVASIIGLRFTGTVFTTIPETIR